MSSYRSPWLDDELESFRGTVRRFVGDVLAPREPAWQAAHQVDAASWREMGAMGLLLCGAPETYGGSGGTFAHDCIVFEELALRRRRELRQVGAQHLRALRRALRHRRAEAALAAATRDRRARRRDRDVRACEPAPTCRASARGRVRNGDAYVLDGSKTFITNGQVANLLMVVDEARMPRRARREFRC